MKKLTFGVLVLFMMSLIVPMTAQAAYENISKDSFLDKMGDWAATMGKSQDDRESTIAERQADRAAERLQQKMREQSKLAEKKMKKFGKDMEKIFK